MIAFGCPIAEVEAYERYTALGIRLASEPDSPLFAYSAVGSTARTYNLMLDAAAELADLEALVLLHPHAELADPDFCVKVRATLRDPDVALVGCAGAAGTSSLAWWEGAVASGPVVQRYTENGGGELPAFSWTERAPAPADVDVLDGFVLVLSPWAVRNLRFDESLLQGLGFDVDLCLQARAAGRRVVVADLRVVEHRALEIVEKREVWVQAHIQLARKWSSDAATAENEWRARARRAEAEREAERTVAYFQRLVMDARVEALEEELAETLATASWRVTRPLREVNKWRRDRRAAANGLTGNGRRRPWRL